MPGIEPIVEESPESDDSKWTVISKYAGDYFFPPLQEEPVSMVSSSTFQAPSWLGGAIVSSISRDQFFNEVRGRFSSIPWQARASRASGIPRAPGATGATGSPQAPSIPIGQPGAFNDQERPFMEALQQGLMAKYAPEARQQTMYRTKREAERREKQVKEFTPVPMSKASFLQDLEDKIGSVQWRAKNPNHAPKVANRPGISKKLQEELDGI
jgi:hypothetical protein